MTILAQDLSLSRPCPVDLDDQFAKSQAKRQYCGHCRHSVHMLSAMTEREAERFLAASEDQDICISYKLNRDGDVMFRPEPIVPLARLRRVPNRLKRFAAVGVTAALAACTPHGSPKDLDNQPEVELQVQSSGPTIPESELEMVSGKIKVEAAEAVEKVEPAEEVEETPCEPEVETTAIKPRRGRKISRSDREEQPKPVKPVEDEMIYGFI